MSTSKVINNTPEIPTLWYDRNDKIQKMYGLTNVMFYNGHSVTHLPGLGSNYRSEDNTREFRIAVDEIKTTGKCTYVIDGESITFTVLYGELISLGSSVKRVGPLISHEAEVPITSKMFENAKSLTDLIYTFANYNSDAESLPSNLFSNNPNLKRLYYAFYFKHFTTIPGDLFSNNLKINSVEGCFYLCHYLEHVGPNLFFKQNELKNLQRVFGRCSSLNSVESSFVDSEELRKNFDSDDDYYDAFTNSFYGVPSRLKKKLTNRYVIGNGMSVNEDIISSLTKRLWKWL